MRLCTKCDKEKDISQFHKKGKKLHSYCKGCFNQYCMKRWIIHKIEAIKYLGGKCKKCNISNIHPVLYDFHHRDKDTKSFSWDKLRLMSDKNRKQELDKCDLLCCMCHRLHHATSELWNEVIFPV